jgi:oxygen-independent coproporphyrinogen-3 oxidase
MRDGVCEITIEANPTTKWQSSGRRIFSVNQKKLTHWLSLGINRISIGVQSFDDATLKTLGRTHTAQQAIDAITMAHKVGFRNINIDLIHSVIARSEATKQSSFIPPEIFKYITHVSAYCLTPTTLDDNESIKQQKQIEKLLATHGLKKYEVSNFARPGFRCLHNLAYWHPQTHEYIGFGLGAHSFIGGERFSNTTNFDDYVIARNKVTKQSSNIQTESIMLALRTTDGVDASLLQNKSAEINLLKSLNLIKEKNGRISATPKGFFVLNQITEKLT